MRFTDYCFGSIRVDGVTYDHDLIIDHGKIRRRRATGDAAGPGRGPPPQDRPRYLAHGGGDRRADQDHSGHQRHLAPDLLNLPGWYRQSFGRVRGSGGPYAGTPPVSGTLLEGPLSSGSAPGPDILLPAGSRDRQCFVPCAWPGPRTDLPHRCPAPARTRPGWPGAAPHRPARRPGGGDAGPGSPGGLDPGDPHMPGKRDDRPVSAGPEVPGPRPHGA